ncbi:unnamed protein product [Protopolystoma xenopodis]|uniref:Uncharacterized protein n=1 Tax=Protopolystoma xenopodis TaxID=117903 RepID=A0A448XR96_9PLAT|nr:unnamed protein product [Protopolystoma xenopodis]
MMSAIRRTKVSKLLSRSAEIASETAPTSMFQKNNRQLVKRIPPSSSGTINLRVYPPNALSLNGSKLNRAKQSSQLGNRIGLTSLSQFGLVVRAT